jgi:hypothetical protein
VPYPILPGRTTDVVLQQEPTGDEKVAPAFNLALPATLSGLIEWDGGTYRIENAKLLPLVQDNDAASP